ncbi:putative ATP-dependent RNA helicase DHX57 [Eurosta solidaginis]|uniref:putative ATP-dependent RNA helicase DHX57 n=1 Tax=Eurosta solidaginis TaxID=178769 RepID=UPI003530D8E1
MDPEQDEGWYLRPLSDPRTTNAPVQSAPAQVAVKTELQELRLSEASQKLTMETLRAIHGPDFRLNDASIYSDRGGQMKKAYWEDRGTLVVQSVTNFSASKESDKNPEDRLRRFALLKLENYGFAPLHCIEAYDHCGGDTDEALLLLYRKYMRIPMESVQLLNNDISKEDMLEMRNDEKSALESIYDKVFEEKEKNMVWSMKFKIDHLLIHSPTERRKQINLAAEATKPKAKPKVIGKARCRNFDRDGTCRFGPKCRFAHLAPAKADDDGLRKKQEDLLNDNEEENWFFLEIRFPPNTIYPFEAPFIYLKTTCHDLPRDLLLLVSRRLYREACSICADGMGCVYSICEALQNEEAYSQLPKGDNIPFPSEEKSLFASGDGNDVTANGDNEPPLLPTHYERGQTSHTEKQRSAKQTENEDRVLMRRFLQRQEDERYRAMMNGRRKLPAFEKMMDILDLIEKSQVIVISGETGCGKSTQVPQFILDNWLFHASRVKESNKLPHVEVVCTQPRRLSAIGVAERVADERTERVGQTVGYQIRLENKITSSTRLTFCTTGILLRRLTADPLLSSVSHVIVDEVHERSEESDFLLMILKDLLKQRAELKVILMSATLNAKLFSDYFGGAPVLDIPGRTFHVEQLFLEDILEVCDYVMECDSQYCRKITKKEEDELMRELEYSDVKSEAAVPGKSIKDDKLTLAQMYGRYSEYSKKTCKSIYLMEPMKINPELVESVLKYIVKGEHDWPKEGTILVFLPGLQEIQAIHETLADSVLFGKRSGNFIVIPLHSSLTSEEQSAIFRPAPNGKRKIVLSTNIAETSITIDDCVFVVDLGLMKEKRFDSNRNMESLELVWVSRANALQRKGRAGRVMPGVCIHLFTGHRFRHNFLAQPVPEIHRVPLEQLVLRIKTLPCFSAKNTLEVLGRTLEPPTEENILSAVRRLQDVGALDETQNLTSLGHHLSALPVDVRIGKLMLYGAIFQCLDSVLTIAACLSHKSPFVSPFSKRAEAEKRKREFAICNSDHLTMLLAYKKWLEVSRRSFFASRNYADEHFLSLKTLGTISEVKYQFLELLVSIGFVPVNIPRKRKNCGDNILELTGTDLNVNGNNNRLLISLLYAALYPNIVKVLTPERSYVSTVGGAMAKANSSRDLRFKTRQDGYVALHPSSINSVVGTFQSPFLIYQEKVKTSRIFIRECSMLPLTPLVLFAGSDFKIELHGGDFLFLLEEGWIILKANAHETAEMIQCLRLELLKLLEEKIGDPCLNLLNHENGLKIIKTIVYLITNNN